jgi:hypothetical protein
VRLRAATQLRGCVAAGGLSLAVLPGNATDQVLIALGVHYLGGIPGSPDSCLIYGGATRILTLGEADGLSSPSVVAEDAAPGGTLSLKFALHDAVKGASCMRGVPLDGACELDCQCENIDPGARCIPTGPSTGRCALSCTSDDECPIARPICDRDAQPGWVCMPTPNNCKACSRYCGGYQDCLGCACVVPAVPLHAPCDCGHRCDAHTICVDGDCRVPCYLLSDCPRGAMACEDGLCR